MSKKEKAAVVAFKFGEYVEEWNYAQSQLEKWRPFIWKFFHDMYWLNKCGEHTRKYDQFISFINTL